jgi:hypothetical protein
VKATSWRGAASLAACALVGMFGGCGCPSEWKSEEATTPSGPWRRASIKVEYRPSFYQDGRTHAPRVTHTLYIHSEDGINVAHVFPVLASEDDVSGDVFSALRKTKYELRFSDDGSALAASADEGARWTIFDLQTLEDSTDDPFWCRHHPFDTLTPWPSLRDLAIEILAAVDPASPEARRHRPPDAVEWPRGVPVEKGTIAWMYEIYGAARYACLHKDDPAVRSALITAFTLPDFSEMNGRYENAVDACVRELAQNDAAVRSQLEAARPSLDPSRARHVEEALRPAKPGTKGAPPPAR